MALVSCVLNGWEDDTMHDTTASSASPGRIKHPNTGCYLHRFGTFQAPFNDSRAPTLQRR